MCKVYVTEWKNPLNQNKSLRTLSHWMQLVSIYGLESFIHRCSCVFLYVILCTCILYTWLIFVSLRWVLYEKPSFKGEKIALDEGDIELTSPFLPPEEPQQDGEAEREARKFIIGSIRRAVRVGGGSRFEVLYWLPSSITGDQFPRHPPFSLIWCRKDLTLTGFIFHCEIAPPRLWNKLRL